MRIIVDANIVVSAILGRTNPIADTLERGVVLMMPTAQAVEAAAVVGRIVGLSTDDARDMIGPMLDEFVVLDMDEIAASEDQARKRLDQRGQSDWPVLAAAMTFDADVWSNDRDFFGIGWAVWSTPNIRFADAYGDARA